MGIYDVDYRTVCPEGVIEGTFYNSFGYFLSLQKVFNDKHSINLTTWGAPTQRATNTAATQEAYDLAGTNLYNPSWGYLDGKKKSSKIVESFDPAALVNWIWKPRMGTTVNTGVGFRHSAYSSSALNWYQSADPRPDYYRYLPSYYNPANPWSGNYLEDGENDPLWDTYEANYQYYRHLWQSDESMRQIDWDAIYRTNLLNRTNYDRNPELVGQSSYILENRHSNFSSWMFNSYVDHRINDFMTLQGGVSFNYTDGHYFKTVRNLLGGEFWRDIDNFSERDFPGNPEILQNNLNDPNRRVKEGDKFGYDYHIRTITAKAWLQNQISTRHWNVNYGLEVSYTNFMRHGEMRNGRAPENSYGPGKRHTFDNAAFKAGATYKINGRNYIVAHASYGTRAPMPDQAYVSPRVKDTAIQGLKSERFLSADIAYVWNYNRFRGSVGGFITEMWNGIKRTGFYDYQLNTFMKLFHERNAHSVPWHRAWHELQDSPFADCLGGSHHRKLQVQERSPRRAFVRERLAGRRYPPRLPQELPYRWHAAAGLQRLAQLCRTEKLVLRAFCQLDGRRIRRPRSVAA